MTMKRITLSVLAAGMLFGTELMARETLRGDLNITTLTTNVDSIVIAQELVKAGNNGANNQVVNINNLNAPAPKNGAHLVFTPKIDQSGTVSDPLFKFTLPGKLTNDFSGAEIREINATGDIQDTTIASFSNKDDNGTNTILRFEGADDANVYDGKHYIIVDDEKNYIDLELSISTALIEATPADMGVELYSTSGTEEKVSEANLTVFSKKPQFKFVCESKLNGLINIEDNSKGFVPTQHGEASMYDDSNGLNTYLTDHDALRFSVVNETNGIDLTLDGNNTRVNLVSSSSKDHTSMFNALENGGLTLVRISDGSDAGSGSADAANKTISFEFNTTIPAGTTEYMATLTTDGSAGLLETNWKAHVWVNDTNKIDPDAAPLVTEDKGMDAGQWKDYVYIAQIAGATNDDSTKTKLFITNRSCKAVTPKVRFIYEGKTVEVDAQSIPVNTQGKILLDKLIDNNAATFSANGIPTRARYAIEITIPGNAEDFYVYAQAQSRTDISATKDLPVYNTSARN